MWSSENHGTHQKKICIRLILQIKERKGYCQAKVKSVSYQITVVACFDLRYLSNNKVPNLLRT